MGGVTITCLPGFAGSIALAFFVELSSW